MPKPIRCLLRRGVHIANLVLEAGVADQFDGKVQHQTVGEVFGKFVDEAAPGAMTMYTILGKFMNWKNGLLRDTRDQFGQPVNALGAVVRLEDFVGGVRRKLLRYHLADCLLEAVTHSRAGSDEMNWWVSFKEG